MQKIKNSGLLLLIVFYAVAGINHFRAPSFYYKIIPPYIPFPVLINFIAGVCEIGFSILLIPPATRRWAAWGIILMLIAFLPVHINMVVNAPLYLSSLKATPLLLWIRLLLLQPLLILWAWVFTEGETIKIKAG